MSVCTRIFSHTVSNIATLLTVWRRVAPTVHVQVKSPDEEYGAHKLGYVSFN